MHTTTIAGIPHRKPNLLLLSVGDKVSIVCEPDNKFDPNALKVMHKDIHLGYIPRMETGHVAGVTTMFITSIQPEQKWKEVTISTEKPETVPDSGFDVDTAVDLKGQGN